MLTEELSATLKRGVEGLQLNVKKLVEFPNKWISILLPIRTKEFKKKPQSKIQKMAERGTHRENS